MTTVADIRTGIGTLLSTVTGLQVNSYVLSNPTPPALSIYPTAVEYDQAFNRGADRWTFAVEIIVSEAMDVQGQLTLDGYLAPSGSSSVKAAIESDKTLGGKAHYAHVTGCTGYRIYDTVPPCLGAAWTVDILVPGT